MKKNRLKITFIVLISGVILVISIKYVSGQIKENNVQVGAYYFDGWTGTYPYHITKSLTDSFPEREPKWGWITSTQPIMDQQLDEASKSGLSFFSFCWYYNGKDKFLKEPLNHALSLYQNSSHKANFKYCLMVANHNGFEIGTNDWPIVTKEWINHFRNSSYLKVEEKPLLIFFSVKSLIKNFGTAKEVHEALDSLRRIAKMEGLNGVSIAACVGGQKEDIKLAEDCGFDVLTGYNYHSVGFIQGEREIPIDNLRNQEIKLWNKFPSLSHLKYIPVSTMNWDPRPWANKKNGYYTAPYYVGYSAETVYYSVKSAIEWINENEKYTPKDKLAILYAWNENGEGAWLTPGKDGINPLDGVKKALNIK